MYIYIYIHMCIRILGPLKAGKKNERKTLNRMNAIFETTGLLKICFGVVGVLCTRNYNFKFFYEMQCDFLYI